MTDPCGEGADGARRAHRRRAAAFTLLEVVLAMTALALVTAICYGAFHLAVRAIQSGEVAVVTAQRLRVASDVMIRQIKSAMPYAGRDEDDSPFVFFKGKSTWMTFITAAGFHGGGGLARVVYQVMDDPPRLVMSESALFSPETLGRESAEETGAMSTVLLEGFHSLRFCYFPSDETLAGDSGDKDCPAREWDGQEQDALPAGVSVLADGVPGLETGVWGMDIPIMSVSVSGEEGAGLQDEDEEELCEGAGTQGGENAGQQNANQRQKQQSADDADGDDAEDRE